MRLKQIFTLLVIHLILAMPVYVVDAVSIHDVNVIKYPDDMTKVDIAYSTSPDAADTTLRYRKSGSGQPTIDTFTDTDMKEHRFALTNLVTDNNYIYWINSPQATQITKSFNTNAPPQIIELKTVSVTSDSITFKYVSDKEVNSTISYSTYANNLDKQASNVQYKKTDTLTLPNLVKDQEYHYQLQICTRDGSCSMSQISSFIAGQDILPQFINATIPEYANDYEFDIAITTKPKSFVNLSVNGLLSSLGFADNDGMIKLRAVGLSGSSPNKLKLKSVDSVGNSAESDFTVIVDTKVPVVKMRAIPAVTFEKPLRLNGTVDEEVTVTWRIADSGRTPKASINIATQTLRKDLGKVLFSWDKVSDASQYIIFRQDIGAIAVITNNSYEDNTLQSSTTYNYNVAAVTSNNKISAASSQITFTTTPDWPVSSQQANAVDVSQFDEKGKETMLTVNGDFELVIGLDEGDNNLEIVFADKANNKVEFKKNVLVDTIPPVILEPHDLSIFSPAYTPGIEIFGKVDTPNATIIVKVNDKTDSSSVKPTSIQGAIEHFKGKKSYTTIADANGDFKVTIELDRTGVFGLENLSQAGMRPTDAGGRGLAGAGRFKQELGQQFVENKIQIIAIDQAGQIATLEDSIEFRPCGTGGAWKVYIPPKEFSPDAVFSEHLLRGIAQFGFNIKLSYQGAGDPKEARITDPPQLLTFELSQADQKKLKYSNMLSTPTHTYSEDYKVNHVLYRLKKWPEGKEEDFKDIKQFKFPLMVEFPYTQTLFGKQVPGYQKTCIDLNIAVEHRLDIEGKIPEAFLESSIGVINNTLELIDMILEPLQQVQQVLFFTCLGSWVVLTLWDFLFNEIGCFNVRQAALHELAFQEGWLSEGDRENEDYPACDSTEDNEGKCESCVESYKRYRKASKAMHLLCDRIFCPSVPSLTLHAQEYRDPYLAGIGGKDSACDGKSDDEYYNVNQQIKKGAKGLSAALSIFSEVSGEDIEDKDACEIEYKREWDHACLLMDEWKQTTTDPDEKDSFSKLYDAVADMCTEKPRQDDWFEMKTRVQKEREVTVTGQAPAPAESDAASTPATAPTPAAPETYTRTVTEQVWEDEQTPFAWKDGKLYRGRKVTKNGVTTVEPEGKPLGVVRDTETGESTGEMFYDKDGDGVYTEGKDDKADIRSNPYLERELKAPPTYIVDPTSGLLRSTQCVCVPAIIGYLQYWKGVLQAVKKCFQSILITKKAKSGMCKAVLTTYVCDLVFDAIRCITKKYSPGPGKKVGAKVSDGIGNFLGALSSSTNKIQNSVVNRYGKTAIFDNLFSERKLINTICVGAFTGDWDLDVEGFLQGALKIPINSEGWIPVATRRFITADPNNDGLATYIYHTSTGIVAGADIDWSLELVCSNSHDCPDMNNPDDACDCAMPGIKEERVNRLDGGFLRAGDSVGADDDVGDRYDQITERYRFDKARLRWSYKDNNGEVVTKEKVNDIHLEGGGPLATCNFDIAEAAFLCESVIPAGGKTRFVGKPKPKKDVYGLNDPIKFDIQIAKKSPGYREPDQITGQIQTKNPKKQIPKWLAYRLYNQNRKPISTTYDSNQQTTDGWDYILLEKDGLYTSQSPDDPDQDIDLVVDIIPDSFKIKEEHFLGSGTASGRREYFKLSDKTELTGADVRGDINTAVSFIIEVEEIQENNKNKPVCKITPINLVQDPVTLQGVRKRILQLSEDITKTGDAQSFACPDLRRAQFDYNGLQIVIRDKNAVGKARIVRYIPAESQSTTQLDCPPGKLKWHMEFQLFEGEKEYPDQDWGYDNFNTNPESHGQVVVSKGGKREQFTGNDAVDINVICREAPPGTISSNTECPGDGTQPLTTRCKCNIAQDIKCGGSLDTGKYCYGLLGQERCYATPLQKCTYSGTETADCDCNKNSILDDNCSSKVCNFIDGSCSSPPVAAGTGEAAETGAASGATAPDVTTGSPTTIQVAVNQPQQFIYNNVQHTLTVASVSSDGNTITVTIQSNPVELHLTLNTPTNVDIDGDSQYDIIVTWVGNGASDQKMIEIVVPLNIGTLDGDSAEVALLPRTNPQIFTYNSHQYTVKYDTANFAGATEVQISFVGIDCVNNPITLHVTDEIPINLDCTGNKDVALVWSSSTPPQPIINIVKIQPPKSVILQYDPAGYTTFELAWIIIEGKKEYYVNSEFNVYEQINNDIDPYRGRITEDGIIDTSNHWAQLAFKDVKILRRTIQELLANDGNPPQVTVPQAERTKPFSRGRISPRPLEHTAADARNINALDDLPEYPLEATTDPIQFTLKDTPYTLRFHGDEFVNHPSPISITLEGSGNDCLPITIQLYERGNPQEIDLTCDRITDLTLRWQDRTTDNKPNIKLIPSVCGNNRLDNGEFCDVVNSNVERKYRSRVNAGNYIRFGELGTEGNEYLVYGELGTPSDTYIYIEGLTSICTTLAGSDCTDNVEVSLEDGKCFDSCQKFSPKITCEDSDYMGDQGKSTWYYPQFSDTGPKAKRLFTYIRSYLDGYRSPHKCISSKWQDVRARYTDP